MQVPNYVGIPAPNARNVGASGSGQLSAPRDRNGRWGPVFARDSTPMTFPALVPALPVDILPPTPVSPVVIAEAPQPADGRVVNTSENPVATGVDEVIRLNIPVPKLSIPENVKPGGVGREACNTTRAYVRDVKKYLTLVRGGDRDTIRCLFVGSTLEGAAKRWYDEWTLARDTFTFEELIIALLARFSPEVQPRDTEARNTLASGNYRMRSGETVPAYQSRFEALITPITNLSENDRSFWFHRGLSGQLAGECATDLQGQEFKSYAQLVQFAQGVELRSLAKHAASRLQPCANALCAQDPGPSDPHAGNLENVSVPRPTGAAANARLGRGRTAPNGPGAGTSRGFAGKGRGRGPKSGERGTVAPATVGGFEPRGKRQRDDSWLPKWGCSRDELETRKRRRVCLRCAADHPTRECPLLPGIPVNPK